MRCEHCGNEENEKSRFCLSCGGILFSAAKEEHEKKAKERRELQRQPSFFDLAEIIRKLWSHKRHCAKCGAPVDTDRDICPFCGCELIKRTDFPDEDELHENPMVAKREWLISELINSENMYMESLECVVHKIMPLFKKHGVSKSHIKTIFPHFGEFLELHLDLYKMFTKDINHAFAELCDALPIYEEYTKKLEKSLSCVDKLLKKKKFNKFAAILGKMYSQSVESFLIMPVQRIPSYGLMLEALVKYTDEEHPDYKSVRKCYATFMEYSKDLNEVLKKQMGKLITKQRKVKGKFQMVSPHRVLIRDGSLTMVKGKLFGKVKKSQKKLMLFNDMVMWEGDGEEMGIRMLSGLKINDNHETKDNSFSLVQNEAPPVQLKASTEEEKMDWTDAINVARDELSALQADRIVSMKEFQSMGGLKFALEDVVVEGKEVKKDDEKKSAVNVRKKVTEAFRQQAIRDANTAVQEVGTFDDDESKDVLNPISSQFVDLKTILEDSALNPATQIKPRWTRKHSKYGRKSLQRLATLQPTPARLGSTAVPSREDPSELAIESASRTVSKISAKVRSSLSKLSHMSKGKKNKKKRLSDRMKALRRKFEGDSGAMDFAIGKVKSTSKTVEEVVCTSEDVARHIAHPQARDFWIKHFGGKNPITDFTDLKGKYEHEFKVQMSQEFCDELLIHFGMHPPYSQHKLFPISVKNFGTITDGLGFPFDLSRHSEVEGTTLLERAQKVEFEQILMVGSLDFIKEYVNSGTNWKLLQAGFENDDTVLHIAAKRGHLNIFLFLSETMKKFENMPTMNEPNQKELLPIHYAAFHTNSKLYDYLKKNSDLSKLKERPVLHEAVRLNQVQCVKSLISRFDNIEDINAVDLSGQTALSIASQTSNHELVELLIDRGAQPRQEDMRAAVESDNAAVVKSLLKNHDPEESDKDLLKSNDGAPLLHHAAQNGTPQVCQVLLEHGADLEEKDESGDTAFLAAAKSGNVGAAKYFSTTDSKVLKQTDTEGKTALHISAEEVDAEMTKSLIQIGVDVNTQDDKGDTPILVAVSMQEFDIVDTLLEFKGTDLHIANNAKELPITIAAKNIDEDTAKKLVAKGADPNFPASRPPLFEAVKQNRVGMAKILLSVGADVNTKSAKKHRSVLHTAAAKENTEMVKTLVAAGADLATQDKEGNTPLHVAVQEGQTEIAEALIKAGAPLNLQNADGNTVMHEALKKRDNNEITDLLLEQPVDMLGLEMRNKQGYAPIHVGIIADNKEAEKLIPIEGQADLKTTDKKKSSALTLACDRNQENLAKQLIDSGADVNHQDSKNRTALCYAAYTGSITMAKQLVSAGANVEVRDYKGVSPLIASADGGYQEVVDLLLKPILDKGLLNQTTEDGRTAVYAAAYAGQNNILKNLLEHGADSSIASIKGWSPLHAAAYKKQTDCVKSLVDSKCDPDPINFEGITPLANAAQVGCYDTVKCLIEHEAMVDPTTSHWTPLQLAILHHRTDVAIYLLKRGANCICENQTKTSAVLYLVSRSTYDKKYMHPVVEAMWTAHPEIIKDYSRLPNWMAALGRANLMKYYHVLGGRCKQKHMEIAAEYNKREVVEYLCKEYGWEAPPMATNGPSIKKGYKQVEKTQRPEKPPKPERSLVRMMTKIDSAIPLNSL